MRGDEYMRQRRTRAAAQPTGTALDEYLQRRDLAPATIARLVGERRHLPVLFGSGAQNQGVTGLLDALVALDPQPSWPPRLRRAARS